MCKQILLIIMASFSVTAHASTQLSVPSVSIEAATAAVERALSQATPAKTRHYCTKETMTCRTIIEYVNKNTGRPLNFFSITFFASERMVAASEFYLKTNLGNLYYRFVDSTFDGKININKSDEVQRVVKNRDSVVIKNLVLPRLGTTFVVTSDLKFDDHLSLVEGVVTDTSNPNYKEPIRIEYLRIK